ncbi:MAG: AAA family ATPase [Deltaproteobacteria bacterium]|nr:AAA family ATPase [Deltaproteobacteria bacterium]
MSAPIRDPAGRVPVQDLDAEAAVLSACILDRAALDTVADKLVPAHFFSDPNGFIWQAIRELRAADTAVDVLTVRNRLKDSKRLDAVGGPGYLAQIVDATPAVANVQDHAQRVIDLATQRRAAAWAHRFAAEAYDAQPNVGAWIEQARAGLEQIARGRPAAPAFELIEAESLFAPLPPTEWLCRHLAIVAGAPCGWFAYAWGGKSIILQDAALSIASGEPIFGQFAAAQGRVVHIDHEQGLRETRDRYQRLARARGLTLESIKGRLAVSPLPSMYLNSPGAYDAYCRAAEGARAVLVDSLAAAQRGLGVCRRKN